MWKESRWSMHDSAKDQVLIHTSVDPIVHFMNTARVENYELMGLLGMG